MPYWWCVKHGRVESTAKGWFHGQRLGPFDTEQQAAHAIEIAHERGEQAEAEDREWRDGQR
jgi:hypothetical protein